MALIPARRRQEQVDIYEFEARQVYIVSSKQPPGLHKDASLQKIN